MNGKKVSNYHAYIMDQMLREDDETYNRGYHLNTCSTLKDNFCIVCGIEMRSVHPNKHKCFDCLEEQRKEKVSESNLRRKNPIVKD